jgi:hypothetical protein
MSNSETAVPLPLRLPLTSGVETSTRKMDAKYHKTWDAHFPLGLDRHSLLACRGCPDVSTLDLAWIPFSV